MPDGRTLTNISGHAGRPDAVTRRFLPAPPFEMARESPAGHVLVTVYAETPSTSAATAAAASPSASGMRWP